MNIDKELLALTSKTKFTFFLSVLSGLLASVCTILLAYFLAKSINEIFLLKKSLSDVQNYIIIFLVFALLKAFFIWYEKYNIADVVSNIKTDLRRELNERLLDDKTGFAGDKKSGGISNTIIQGVESLDKYFSEYLPQLFFSALTPLLILFFVFPLDVISGVVFIITAPLIPLLMYLIGSSAEELNNKQWSSLSKMSGHFLDVLQGILTLKIFGRANDEIQKIKAISLDFKSATMKVLKIAFLSALVLELLSTISIAIIAVEVGLRLMYGEMKFENAFFVLILAPEFYLPLRQLGARYHAGLEGIAAFNSIKEILSLKRRKDKLVRGDKNFILSDIKLEKINLKYSNRDSASLYNVSCVFEKGKTTAIIGESGAGKSTLLKVLMRFEKFQSGELFFDGIESSQIPDDEWYRNVAWVPQNPHLFHTSIYENIAMGNNDVTKQEIISAAQKAYIHETILKFNNGYNSIVGERGSTLSGGEKQRIAIARAFVKKSPIIIMDEPTSGIDSITEKEISKSILELFENRTVIIAAHRLNTILNADKIIVMENGMIVGEGTHNNLIKGNRFYQKLYKTFKREI